MGESTRSPPNPPTCERAPPRARGRVAGACRWSRTTVRRSCPGTVRPGRRRGPGRSRAREVGQTVSDWSRQAPSLGGRQFERTPLRAAGLRRRFGQRRDHARFQSRGRAPNPDAGRVRRPPAGAGRARAWSAGTSASGGTRGPSLRRRSGFTPVTGPPVTKLPVTPLPRTEPSVTQPLAPARRRGFGFRTRGSPMAHLPPVAASAGPAAAARPGQAFGPGFSAIRNVR